MSEHRPYDRSLSISIDQKKPSKAEIDALELKIVELTGVAEYIAQKIAISQVNSERLEKEVEDFRRVRQQIETDIRAQEELIANKRRETHELEIEIKKHEMTISGQQEQTRTLAETIAIAEKRSRQAIEDFQAETDEKIRAIKHEFESERERINIGFEVHRNQAQAEMKQFNEEMAQTRKKQERAREIEVQEAKKKAEETIEKLLHEGRSKNEALIKATEATALEVHRESEASAKRLLAEASQKAADITRAAQLEAEDVRRRTHNAEVSFLKEKNTGIAELKLMVANAKEEAQGIISAATKEASEIQHKVENENEAKITAANTKISMARKTSEKETEEYIERSKAEIMKQVRDQELILARKNKETDERSASERKNIEDESRLILTSARERAQAIIETANNEKNYKFIELKALEGSMLQSARQSVAEMTSEAEKISLKIVEEARLRAKNVEKSVESIIAQATDEALKIKADADAYSIKIRRDLPDPANWDAELAKIRQQEQDRLQALIEPTVKNYLKAIDMALNEIFVDLPTKFHSNKVIQDFAKAVSNIQYKKEQIKFSDLIPKLSNSSHTGTSLPPLKKSS